jgi:hypothetical protein
VNAASVPRWAAGPVVLLLTAVAAGCGIRTTDVPVDGGPAPTRATCDVPAQDGEAGTEVYLVCGSQVASVHRSVDLPGRGGDPAEVAEVAEVLLAELQSDPGKEEQAAGFRTHVPSDLEVTSPPGDTVGTGDAAEPVLRLSQGPEDLPVSALVQIICTFAHSEPLGNGQSVVLGGPDGSTSENPKAYTCSAAARASPEGGASDVQPGLPSAPPATGQEQSGTGDGYGDDSEDGELDPTG